MKEIEASEPFSKEKLKNKDKNMNFCHHASFSIRNTGNESKKSYNDVASYTSLRILQLRGSFCVNTKFGLIH